MASDAVLSVHTKRGRQSEFERVEAGEATIVLRDELGHFDPTNTTGPYYGNLKPLKQWRISYRHPDTAVDHPIFTGYNEKFSYQRTGPHSATTTVPLVDGFELLTQAQVRDSVSGGAVFAAQHCDARILAGLADAGWAASRTDVASGNVDVQEAAYDPGTPILQVLKDAAEAEWPGIGMLFMDKRGYVAFNGRYIRFLPENYAPGGGAADPDYPKVRFWELGDNAACLADPTLVPIANDPPMIIDRGKDILFNSALVLPLSSELTVAQLAAQRFTDGTSVNQYGFRGLPPITGLLTLQGDDGLTGLQECRLFARGYVENYKNPTDRIESLTVKVDRRKPQTIDLVLQVDLGHVFTVTTTNPGGGGFTAADHFVEGIENTIGPGVDEDGFPIDWTATFNLSPRALWTTYPS